MWDDSDVRQEGATARDLPRTALYKHVLTHSALVVVNAELRAPIAASAPASTSASAVGAPSTEASACARIRKPSRRAMRSGRNERNERTKRTNVRRRGLPAPARRNWPRRARWNTIAVTCAYQAQTRFIEGR
jgi:hypothetical protein